MSIGSTPAGEEIAGWVLKGDPKVYDLDGELETQGVILNWSVYEKTYRPKLMAEGQRCFMWRSGPDGAIVAAGYVTGPVYEAQAEPSEWVDESKARAADLFVPIELYPLDEAISRAELTGHPVLSHVEFLHAKQMSNPTILTVDELEAMEELVEGLEPGPPPLAVIGTKNQPFSVFRGEPDGFVVIQKTDDGDFIELSEHDVALDAVLAAAAAAAGGIEAEPVVEWDEGGTIVGTLEDDEGELIGLYKIENGYQAIMSGEGDEILQIGDDVETLADLIRYLFEPGSSGGD